MVVFKHCRTSFQRKVVRDHPLDHHTHGFTTSMVVQAIKACSNSVITSLDGLTMLHIKHLSGDSAHLFPHPHLHPVPKVC